MKFLKTSFFTEQFRCFRYYDKMLSETYQNSKIEIVSILSILQVLKAAKYNHVVSQQFIYYYFFFHFLLSNSVVAWHLVTALLFAVALHSTHYFLIPQKILADIFTCLNSTIETPTVSEICSLVSFWCLYCYLWIDFTHCSGISIVDCEQVNIRCEMRNTLRVFHYIFWEPVKCFDKNIEMFLPIET